MTPPPNGLASNLIDGARAQLAPLSPIIRQAADVQARGGLESLNPDQKTKALDDTFQARLLFAAASELARLHDAQKIYFRLLLSILLLILGVEGLQAIK